MRILVATDAWHPQVNGVVVTLRNTIRALEALGHDVATITPDGFATIPCPTYPEIRLSLFAGGRVAREIERYDPHAVHIATEGPLGLAARRHCVKASRPFTTAYHTQFPEYVHARSRLPLGVTYRWMRWFHAPSQALLVATPARNMFVCASRFTVISAPWLWPVTPIRSRSTMPSSTALSTAAFASATSCSRYVSYAFLGSPTIGDAALSMIAYPDASSGR